MILNNYINREILRSSGAILMVLILIFISTRFIKYIQLAVEGTISSSAVFSLLGLQIPAVAGFLLPLSLFIAILLTLGRLHSENEMAVIRSVGVGEVRMAHIILPLATVFALLAATLSFWVTPWASQQAKTLLAKEKSEAQFGAFSPGKFRENAAKSGVVFVESKGKQGKVKKLFAVSGINQTDKPVEIQLARSGNFWQQKQNKVSSRSSESNNYLVLEDGSRYQFDSTSNSWQVSQYDSYFMLVESPKDEPPRLKNKSIATSLLLARGGSAEWAELHWRLSAPLSIPVLCFLAVPLARTQPRKGKFSRLFPAIMVYMVYALLMMNSRRLLETEQIPLVLGFWWIHAIFVSLCVWLYRPRPVRSRIRGRVSNV